MKKKVALLGATGSIGKSTQDILQNEKNRFEPVLFSAYKNSEELLRLKKKYPGALTALASDSAPSGNKPEQGIDFFGKEGLLNAISAAGADITINGIAGAAGFEPSLAVVNSGSNLALANKETIVMAGHIILPLAKKKNLNIIPVDSEHAAIFRLLEGHDRSIVDEIILTASGGPFRKYSSEQLRNIIPEEALAHPTWSMGPKISVDSATMANKGLELIEAAVLFGFPPEKIKVVIHPESIVHSMLRLTNGAVYAQMSLPDMRLPIHDALCWPETEVSSYGNMVFDSLALNFDKCDLKRFPMLSLAYEALKAGHLAQILYNASNEIAVEAFLKGKITFLEIPVIVGYVLNQNIVDEKGLSEIEAVLAIDLEGRKLAREYIANRS